MENLNKRELELLNTLNKKEFLSVEKIAKILSVSTKTVYRDIERIEKKSNIVFLKKPSKGIKLSEDNRIVINEDIKKVKRYSLEERRIKLLLWLLENTKDYVTTESLAIKY